VVFPESAPITYHKVDEVYPAERQGKVRTAARLPNGNATSHSVSSGTQTVTAERRCTYLLIGPGTVEVLRRGCWCAATGMRHCETALHRAASSDDVALTDDLLRERLMSSARPFSETAIPSFYAIG
jgi:hypothetical protein